MTRYIDADALKYEPLPKGDRNYRTYNLDDAYDDGYYDAFTDIRNAPTIDAEPVRHGKWILDDVQDEEENANDNYKYRCSCCGYSDLHAKNQTVSYCWNCGARMDEE